MNTYTVPQKVSMGDEVRIIAPSRSMAKSTQADIDASRALLESLGFIVSYGQNVSATGELDVASRAQRVADLHNAFSDSSVKMIFAFFGGYHCNQIVDLIDYDLIAQNPKIFCGFSDITAIANAIAERSRIVTYSGPNAHSLSMRQGINYTRDSIRKTFMSDMGDIAIKPASQFIASNWIGTHDYSSLRENKGFDVMQSGACEGTLIGGNMSTIRLLQGTSYMTSIKDPVLFLEDDDVFEAGDDLMHSFVRDLVSFLQCGITPRGLLIGRFESEQIVNLPVLAKVLRDMPALQNIPIIANVDFGHTYPQAVMPIGGTCRIDSENEKVPIILTKY